MPRKTVLLALLLSLLAATSAPDASAAERPGCKRPATGKQVVRGSRVTIWRADHAVWACHRRTGRLRALWQWSPDHGDAGYFHTPARYATHGNLAALAGKYADKYGTRQIQVFVMDARRGRMVHQRTLNMSSSTFWITGFVLAPSAATAIAYAGEGAPTRIAAYSGVTGNPYDPPVTLDDDADPRGLRLVSRTDVEWLDGGVARRGTLAPG